MVAHSCNPSIWEAEARKSQVPDQPGLQKETLSQKEKELIKAMCTLQLFLETKIMKKH
jgi:hypothetical protein